MISITFRDRKSLPWIDTSGLTFTIRKYSHAAIGGPDKAEVEVSGSADDLYRLLDWCRYEAEIDYLGSPVWWGLVSRIEVTHRGLKAVADLEKMSNRVAVAYTTVAVGKATTGVRGTTAWAQDDISVSQFGIKELLDSHGGTTSLHAEASRDGTLRRYRYPTGRITIDPVAQGGEAKAVLYLVGWWSTLDWRYATVPILTALEFSTIGNVTLGFGTTTVWAVAESFDIATSVNLVQLEIYVRKIGSPGDNLRVEICANPNDTAPGSILAGVDLPAASVGSAASWVRVTLSSPLALTAGSTYFLMLSRTGSNDNSNYYQVTLDGAQGYGAGVFLERVSGTWTPGGADMPFRLYSNVLMETTQQIKSLITSYGQFLRRVYLDVASGFYTESYRNGDSTAGYEVEDLMEIGITDLRRLLAKVYSNRSVSIYPEPLPIEILYLGKDGMFYNRSQMVDPATCPVAFWARIRDALPASVDTSRLSGLDAFFVEHTEYNVSTGKLSFLAYGDRSPYDLGVQRG